MLEAAPGGLCVAYVLESVAQPFLDTGRLLSLLPDWCQTIPGLLLYYPSGKRMPPPLRAFVDVLPPS